MRDLRQVYAKLRIVLLPIGRDSSQSILQKLRECNVTHIYFIHHA